MCVNVSGILVPNLVTSTKPKAEGELVAVTALFLLILQ